MIQEIILNNLNTSIGLEKIAINRPATFHVDIHGQPSTLDVRVLSPSRRVIPSVIESISESRYSVEYIPSEVGKVGLDFIVSIVIQRALILFDSLMSL